jgi:predicted small metal-binding protein
MYELDCSGVIPGCQRIIRAESQAEVFRRAVVQAKQLGVDRITPTMLDTMRQKTQELPN